jgi:hypothetical protein
MGIEGRGRYSPTHLLMNLDGRVNKEQVEALLSEHEINFGRSAKMNSSEDRNVGWATSAEVDEADFSNRDSWDFDSVSMIYLREDRKVIDTAAKKRLVASRIKLWLEENNRQRCPATIKADIKMNVDVEMAMKAQIKAKIVEVAIHWNSSWAVVSSQTESSVDTAIKLLNQTFKGMASFTRKKLDDMIEDEVDDAASAGAQILEKLWNHLDQEGDLTVDGASIELGSTAVLSSGRGKTTIKGDLTREEIEAAATAGGRKTFEALGIKICREERDFELTILAAGFMMKDLVRPPFPGDSREADILIGTDLYNEAHEVVCAIARWGVSDSTSGEE